ncbi:MAG TPA: hypothetical protein VFH31_05510 [Pyrinomonadaceae bacterium]|nr:hypothetical protein [Pyrinomonadaceae bacterium]
MEIVPFKPEHLAKIRLQGAQEYLTSYIDPASVSALQVGSAFSAIEGDLVLGSAGVISIWHGRGIAWAWLSKDCGKYFVRIHRAVKRFLDMSDINRIEATVDCDFHAGHEWIHMLGFELEAERMRGYRPDGGDMSLYARVKK